MNRRKLLITAACLIAMCTALFAKADTYTYDYWNDIEKSPDA